MPQNFPARGLGTLLTISLALVSGAVTFGVWHHELPPIQSLYLPTYLTSDYVPSFSLTGHAKPKRYSVITVNGKDATLATMPETLEGVSVRYTFATPESFGAWLRRAIYQGRSGLELIQTPLVVWGVCLLLSMLAGTFFAKYQKHKAHEGTKLRGPDLISRREFNRRVKGDGFPIRLENKRNPFELLQGSSGKYLRIERKYENNHILTMADPGGGKTSLFIQILDEVARRGNEAAIIYDPHIQYTPRYFNAGRGDIILNPLDALSAVVSFSRTRPLGCSACGSSCHGAGDEFVSRFSGRSQLVFHVHEPTDLEVHLGQLPTNSARDGVPDGTLRAVD